MRITEQIDAIDVMGINSANFLILPKMFAALLFNPILVIFSMGLGLIGGWFVAYMSPAFSVETYLFGVQSFFVAFEIYYALIKSIVFAFIIVSISGFYGYTVNGGALEVGKNSTKAVVHSSIAIILFNLIITQLLLT
jgi:phospholipid/cholesterol/gamma-HCH transport system permease protein